MKPKSPHDAKSSPTIDEPEVDSLLDYFWPSPYPQHLPPIQVAFSNGLSEGYKDTDHMVFVIPFNAFKSALLAHDLALIPKKVPDGPIDHTAKENSIPWETGYNAALDLMADSLRKAYGGEK